MPNPEKVPSYFEMPAQPGEPEDDEGKVQKSGKKAERRAEVRVAPEKPKPSKRELAEHAKIQREIQSQNRLLEKLGHSLARYAKSATPKAEEMRNKILEEINAATAKVRELSLKLRGGEELPAAEKGVPVLKRLGLEREWQSIQGRIKVVSAEEADQLMARSEAIAEELAKLQGASVEAVKASLEAGIEVREEAEAAAKKEREAELGKIETGWEEIAKAQAAEPAKKIETALEDSEDYKILYRELAELVAAKDAAALKAFRDSLRLMARDQGSEMQPAAKALLEKLEEAAAPSLEELKKKSLAGVTVPAGEAAERTPEEAKFDEYYKRKKTVEELSAGAKAAFARKREAEEQAVKAPAKEARANVEKRIEEFQTGTAAVKAEIGRALTEEIKAGEVKIAAAGKAAEAAARGGFSRKEADWFEEGESPEYQKILELAEAMGAENIRDAADLIANKVKIGEALTAAEAELIDEAFANKILPYDSAGLEEAVEKLTGLREKITEVKAKSWRNRLGGIFATAEMKSAIKEEEAERMKLVEFNSRLEDLWKRKQTRAGAKEAAKASAPSGPKSILGLSG